MAYQSENFDFVVVDSPYQPDIDGCAYIRHGKNRIFLPRELAEWVAIELMRAYELEWWPEPEDDPTPS